MRRILISISTLLLLIVGVLFSFDLFGSNTITVKQALADTQQFQEIIEEHSSYVQLTDYDYEQSISTLSETIAKSTTPIEIHCLTNELAKIMAEVGDRHSKVSNEYSMSCSTCDLYFPFQMAVLGNQVVAIRKIKSDRKFEFMNSNYPYVKSINGLPVKDFMNKYAFRHKKAPELSRLIRGYSDLRKMGKRFVLNDSRETKQIDVLLTNGVRDRAMTLPLSKKDKRNFSLISYNHALLVSSVNSGDVKKTTRRLSGNIGYLNIPKMYRPEDAPEFVAHIEATFDKFSKTKAMIIDLRGNGGGGREIIRQISAYIVPPAQSPWVANVAYLRTNENVSSDQKSMSGRLLHTYDSEHFDSTDRRAIQQFRESFSIEKTFDKTKFSVPFYMVLKSGKQPYTKPVYILVDERVFSAASVFTAAFKGLPNVTIAGVTTDGSSGRSRNKSLEHSDIQIKVSTMLSFQRNGKTLDGNGTIPDIVIPADEAQLFWQKDSQLEELIKIINSIDRALENTTQYGLVIPSSGLLAT